MLDKEDISTAKEIAKVFRESKVDELVVAGNLITVLLAEREQQRTWVGLDEEDDIDWEEGGSLRDLVEAVEAKLREKNT
jgi:Icc-related predicted phosphoesterase